MVDAKKRGNQLVSREYTINLHKKLHRCTFKKCAPKAIKMVRGVLQCRGAQVLVTVAPRSRRNPGAAARLQPAAADLALCLAGWRGPDRGGERALVWQQG